MGSLHAAAVVAARDRERLEKLCRYAGRPAIAESPLRDLPDGRAAYSLKKQWRGGFSGLGLFATIDDRERDASGPTSPAKSLFASQNRGSASQNPGSSRILLFGRETTLIRPRFS